MGLAASQGRYLCLTARMSDLVYEGQQISQQRMALANEAQLVSDAYNKAMSNTVLQAIPAEGDMQRLTYEILTSQDPFTGLGMRLVDLNGNVVVPKKSEHIEVTSKNDEGEEVKTKYTSNNEFIEKYMTDLDEDSLYKLSTCSISELYDYYNEHYSNPDITVTYNTNINSALKKDDERFLYDENCTDPAYLQQMLENGEWLIEQATTDGSGWDSLLWQGSNVIREIYDTSDDAAAEAKYESEMNSIQRKDKLLELRLEQVQTEESSVEKEIDSVKQIIGKNVEDSFGTFA